ncbi:MAG: alpha/beta fold hydrolase [Patescibacteria group bacterium]
MRFVLIHGFKASSASNFWPWLRDELRKRGHEVISPDLPDPEHPDPEVWIKTLLDEVGSIDDKTIVVGHSLGAAMALRFLEAAEARSTPKGCLLISPPWMISREEFRGFFLSELDFDVIMWKAAHFVILHAKDDPVIPFDHAKKYQSVLHGELIEGEVGDGHFNTKESYSKILAICEQLASEKIEEEPGKEVADQFEHINY